MKLNYKYRFPARQDGLRTVYITYSHASMQTLRISEVLKMSKETMTEGAKAAGLMIYGDKAGEVAATAPLTPFAHEILFNRDLSRNLSQQTIQSQLRKAFEECIPVMPASFVGEVQYSRITGGKADHVTGPKYKFLNFNGSMNFFESYIAWIRRSD